MSLEINDLQVGHKFGEGTFGESYVGRAHGDTSSLLAIKRLHSMAIDRSHLNLSLTRLQRIANGEGIAKVVSWNIQTSPYWIASEFQGNGSECAQTIGSLFGTFRNEEEAFALLLELATTLGAIHGEGIVHGNLHPGNVFLAPEGSGATVRIADFGQAFIGAAHHVSLNTESLRTLPPEQLLRPDEYATPGAFRWDVYAFGVLAYRILTGEWPRGQKYIDSYSTECEAHPGGVLPLDVSRFVENLGSEESIRWFTQPDSEPCQRIRDVISDCLSLFPEQRPRTGGDIQIRLAQIAHDIKTARAQRDFAAERSVLKRKLWMTRAAALILVSMLTLATLYGVTTLFRAIVAEKQVVSRDSYMTDLSSSLAESNSAYAASQDQLLKSREAADRFFALLSRQNPLSPHPENPVETEGEWLRFAREYYAGSLGRAIPTWNSDLESARGHHSLAHAALALEDNAAASDHFSKAVGILEHLAAKEQPGELHAELFARLGDCHRQLWIQQPHALSDAALEHLDRSARAYQTAMESRPDDGSLVLNAAAGYFYLGLHQAECHFENPALVSYSRSLELLSLVEKLRPAEDPDRFLAARNYTASGTILNQQGRKPAALDTQIMALEILLDLTGKHPQQIDFEVELARCYCELGTLFQSVSDDEDAPEGDPYPMFNEANRLLLSVLLQSPDHPRATVALALTYMGQSKLNLSAGRTADAVRLAQQAVGLLTNLVEQHPENRQLPFQLAHHKVEYMQLLAAVSRSKDAIELGEEASVALENLLDESKDIVVEPVIKNYQIALADLYEQLGTLNEKTLDTVTAAGHYARAVGYWELLASNYGSEHEIGLRLKASRDMLKRVSQ